MTKAADLLKRESAVILFGVNSLVALLSVWWLHLSPDQTGAVAVVATSVLALAVAALTRPPELTIVKGAVSSALVAFAAFGAHISPSSIAIGMTVLSTVLGLFIRSQVTPRGTP
jgi:hypothetical protein